MRLMVLAYLEDGRDSYNLLVRVDDKTYMVQDGQAELGRPRPDWAVASAVSKYEFTPVDPPMAIELGRLSELSKVFGCMLKSQG